ncbi:MAG: nitroreductase family protein [Clostridiaceae bacterium]
MINLDLYEAIFHRKSIRKYNLEPLSGEDLKKIADFVDTIKPLDSDMEYEFVYLSDDSVKNLLPIKAPHYICMYSKKKDKYLLNAGYMMQQLDLFLSNSGIGSCWLGLAKPSKDVMPSKNGLEYVIMLAFGNCEKNLYRAKEEEFNRKPIAELTNVKEQWEVLEPVRLAPSSSNTQPWYFSGTKDKIIISREKLNIFKEPLYGKMNQIDIGIALCHLILSLEHLGSKADLDFTKTDVPNGNEFMVSVLSSKE